MRWNKKYLKQSNLYLILDHQVYPYEKLFQIMKQAVQAGVDIVQLRDKQGSSRDIISFSQKAMHYLKGRAAYVINDRVDIAQIVQADGVHVGQEDIPVPMVRSLVRQKMMIGVSCQSLAMVKQAERDGADYIGFGSVFKTQTKPHRDPMNQPLLKRVVTMSSLPIFPIGGINLTNIDQVINSGATRVAVCRDIACAPRISEVVKKYKNMLDRL